MAHTIEVTMHKDGTTSIKVEGVKGPSCKELTKEFEESLGKKVSDVETSEVYEHEDVQLRTKV